MEDIASSTSTAEENLEKEIAIAFKTMRKILLETDNDSIKGFV